MKQLETIKFLSNKQQTAEHQKVGSKRGQKETTVKIYAFPPLGLLRSVFLCFRPVYTANKNKQHNKKGR